MKEAVRQTPDGVILDLEISPGAKETLVHGFNPWRKRIEVEGRRDVDSLRSLGINGDIRLACQKPLLEFTENLSKSGKEIVLLTDWDKKGGITARKIINHLLTYGIMPNTDLRSRIGSLVKKRIKDIESLNKYVNKLRDGIFSTL